MFRLSRDSRTKSHHMLRCHLTLLLVGLAASIGLLSRAAPAAGQQAAASEPTFEQRLEKLAERLERARVDSNVPGMGLAVVKDDKLVFARGFGHADIAENSLVTPHTRFAIGSCTKAFTATLVGMLVDEGLVSWDDPLSKHIPYLNLKVDSDDPDAQVTIADALSHRTGYTRMTLLTATDDVPMETSLLTASKAEPWDKFRQRFHYTNIMVMAAGEAAASATDSDWHTLVRQRLLKPLGMPGAYSLYADAVNDETLATGYLYDTESEEFEAKEFRKIDKVGAAGAINASVTEMAQWLRFQLAGGVIDGKRLLSAANHAKTWEPHIQIAGQMSYGLGWILEQWNGQPIIQHGGNVDGFSAMTAMAPQSNLGFVLLTNVGFTPLQESCRALVWDTLLGEWPDESATAQPGQYDDYLGVYLANHGSFDNTPFTVLEKDGKLHVDIPGQMTFELKEPDAQGRRYFAITNEISATFDRNDAGQVVALRMQQGGINFEMPRKDVEIPIEIPLDELKPLLGPYRFEQLSANAKVLMQNNRLALDVPGEMVYELHPPDDDGWRKFRVLDPYAVRFNTDDDGRVTSLSLRNPQVTFELPRIEDENPLPTVAQVLKLRNAEARRKFVRDMGTVRTTGTMRLVNSGLEATFIMHAQGLSRSRVDIDFGVFGNMMSTVDGDVAEEKSSIAPYDKYEGGKMLDQARVNHPHTLIGALADTFDSMSVEGREQHGDLSVILLKVGRNDLPKWTLYIDEKTGDVLRANAALWAEGIGAMPQRIVFEDFRESGVPGIRIPYRNVTRMEWTGTTIMQTETTETNIEASDNLFRIAPTNVGD